MRMSQNKNSSSVTPHHGLLQDAEGYQWKTLSSTQVLTGQQNLENN